MTKAEMGKFNISPDEDSSSYSSNSNDFSYSYPTKPTAMKSHYVDMDPENQNFLLESNLGKKKYETEYHPGTTSFGMSVFNLSNAIVGSGILGLSYAMANTGIALFVILLIFVSMFSLYSVHLLLKTANEGGSLLYEQLGLKAFGLAGKLAASGSITMQNIGAMSSYLFIVKYELPLVIKAFMNIEESTGEWYLNGDYLVILVSLLLILPLSLLKNLGYLGYTSGFSLLCMVFFLIVVIWKKFQIPCPMDHDLVNTTLNGTVTHSAIAATVATAVVQNFTSDDMCTPKYFIVNSQTVYAVPILTFSFVCHPAILPIYEELKGRSRRRMMKVSNVSFFAMFLMYLLAALFGYLTFYRNVEPELLHTYSAVLGTDVVLLIVRLAVLLAVTLTVPVVIFPIRSSITQLLCASKEFSWMRHCLITVSLLVFTNVLVIFVPTIRDIFGFIGASAAAMLIFILPSAFYIKLVKKEPIKSVQKIGAILFLLAGILVMTGCMTLIILDWTHNSGSDGH
ncbi:sodium-coupled neutral amino acid symporter 2 [Alligator mississippiensis]|uniref:Sodium-coupled neutral amino acid symporter 2 n=1 Tax=Alligator mississippiensis TaxID=8496 RepID=A0A151PFW3_ALLMI|nr:sodium-coupled neutral amino acid symporter 2 [Alligator mississippiensis]XP_019348391.1 sodium-coupled neutral amino acid symporter 2 [Alligator mississippiensis]KYO47675.1 sodium-coupled neutral amino acid transporter 2 [Alligator mississippiensis]